LPSAQEGTFRDSQLALILRALHASGWIVAGPRGAAARLGLKRTTLISKMKKVGISRPVRRVEVAGLDPEPRTGRAVPTRRRLTRAADHD
jgi:hypothetical protein